VPEKYKDHQYVFHNPYIFVPRINSSEIKVVAETINSRLADVNGRCIFLIPEKGVSRYSVEGGALVDRASDTAFFEALKSGLPQTIEVKSLDYGAEDPEFVTFAVNSLVSLIEDGQ